MDPVIETEFSTSSQEIMAKEPSAEKQVCTDVFLTSSIDGTISLWDRRQDRMVARLGPRPLGTPPWCMSVVLCPFKPLMFRHAGLRMAISFMQVGGMELSMNIQCINLQVLRLEASDSLEIRAGLLLYMPCQMAGISSGIVQSIVSIDI
jgi:hypothetical protein